MKKFGKTIVLNFVFIIILSQQVFALEIVSDAVFVRIIDTGPGLATVTRMPGDFYMVYDAGHWHGKNETMAGIASVIPDGESIDLLIVSHSDSDHLAAVKQILNKYKVNTVIYGGLERTTTNWKQANAEINKAGASGRSKVINLKHDELHIGSTFFFKDTLVTFVSGFYTPPDHWNIDSDSEFKNAGSIIIRLSYHDKSILFTGDAVGRHIGDPSEALRATEKFIVNNKNAIKINSDVLIAPHHGADNANSTEFIKAVSPEWVIFSAGHKYGHPLKVVAQRYLNFGVNINNIFRTDLGDDENRTDKPFDYMGNKEWDYGKIKGHKDLKGDDDIDILIHSDGTVKVEYRLKSIY